MAKLRMKFIKEEQAAWISHLDLMRTFQRCFPRTELEIKHTQGYHPHPIISIVLPLPVGQSSQCELLDFEVTQQSDGSGIAEKLNTGMPAGIRVLKCYEVTRPVRELYALQADVTLEYDNGVPAGAAEAIHGLLHRESLIIEKRTKRKAMADVDIRPMLGQINCPVLALNGTKDIQVCHESNLDAIREGLPSNPKNSVLSVEGKNHLFQHCRTGSVAEYRTIEETIAPEVLELIASWISELFSL